MARIIVEEQVDFATFPTDSILHLKVEEVEVRDVEGRRGPWQKLEWKFKILGIQVVGDGSPAAGYENAIASSIWGSCSFKLTDSPDNKLRLWAEATLGIELGVGYELDTDHFVGREVRGITSTYEKRAKDRNGNPLKQHQVESLLPMGSAMPQAPAQPPAQQGWSMQQPAQPMQQQPAAQPVAAQANPWVTPQGGDPWGSEPGF